MRLSDHLRLATALRKSTNWLLSYDDAAAIQETYAWARCHRIPAQYKFNQHGDQSVKADELIILPPERPSNPVKPARK
jgi:hypothetical protein